VKPPVLRAALAGAALAAGGGCGLSVQSSDLFLLTRSGPGQQVTMLVSDGGTIRCNGRPAKPLPDPLLIDARQLASDLDKDAKAGLRITPGRTSVYRYTMKLQNGTISFPDTAGSTHPELARVEQFALQAAQGPCLGVP
jgi:hypothetical protein